MKRTNVSTPEQNTNHKTLFCHGHTRLKLNLFTLEWEIVQYNTKYDPIEN